MIQLIFINVKENAICAKILFGDLKLRYLTDVLLIWGTTYPGVILYCNIKFGFLSVLDV